MGVVKVSKKKTELFSRAFLEENIMGPNPVKLLEELLRNQHLPAGSLVMDLGCGRGVTSIALAKEYGLRVFATDLWISATDNKKRFDAFGLGAEQIIPIHADAHDLPYAEEFFDAVVSVDAYHYFGLDETYLRECLLSLVKHGGYLLIAVPGLKKDIHDNIPEELLRAWTAENLETMHDMAYWRSVLGKTEEAEIVSMSEMGRFDECWNDWLKCENEYARGDRKAMEAGAGKYLNFISIILRRK